MTNRIVALLAVLLYMNTTWARFSEADQIEGRIQSYLSMYLDSEDFLVYVNPIKEPDAKKKNQHSAAGMPHIPGLSTSEKKTLEKILDAQNEEPETDLAFNVRVIVGSSVSQKDIEHFKSSIPKVARIDMKRGDVFSIQAGTVRKNKTSKSLFGLSRKVSALVEAGFWLMLVVGTCFLFGYLVFKFKNKMKLLFYNIYKKIFLNKKIYNLKTQPKTIQPPAKSIPKKLTKEQQANEILRDLEHIVINYPDKIAGLIGLWVNRGERGVKDCAILLRNFNISSIKDILDNYVLVPNGIDTVINILADKYDVCSDENIQIIYKARLEIQNLFKVAKKNPLKLKQINVLNKINDEEFKELVKNERPSDLAILSTAVPQQRMTRMIEEMKLGKEFFLELCQLDQVDKKQIFELNRRLDGKVKDAVRQNILNKQNAKTLKVKKIRTMEDVLNLPDATLKVLLKEHSPVTMENAFYYEPEIVKKRIGYLIPEYRAALMNQELGLGNQLQSKDIERSIREIIGTYEEFLKEQIIKEIQTGPKSKNIQTSRFAPSMR